MSTVKNFLAWPVNRFKNFKRGTQAIVLAVVALLIFWRINVYRNSGLQVETYKVERGNITETVDASGEISAENSANLTFQTSGKVTEVNYKEGDYIEKNDIIAKLDTTTLYAAYKQADATLRAAEAALDSTYDTLQGKEKTETFAEISTRTTAETTKDKSYWAYVAASKALEGAYIKAPFDGILTQVPDNVVPGSQVALPSGTVFQVVGPQTVFFDAEVSELDIVKIEEGAKVIIEVDAYPDKEFDGVLSGINFSSTQTSTGGTAYNVRIEIEESRSANFMLGMNGDAAIILNKKDDVILLPLTAVVEDGDKKYVWEAVNGLAEKIEIKTGLSSINFVEVTSGLSENDLVVERPPSNIEEGTKLKLK